MAGEQYTYRLSVPEVGVSWVDLAQPGTYAGGRADSDPDHNLLFNTYVSPAS